MKHIIYKSLPLVAFFMIATMPLFAQNCNPNVPIDGGLSALLVAGAENMTMVPHLVYGSRFGTKYGALKTQDLLLDTLSDKHVQTPTYPAHTALHPPKHQLGLRVQLEPPA